MLLESAPLEETVAGLRSGELDLHQYVDEMCDRITALDAQLWAFVSEPDRRGRLHREADALLARYPQPATAAGAVWRPGGCQGYLSRRRLCDAGRHDRAAGGVCG